MGFLSSFARGAAGPGLLQVAQMQQRQNEMEMAAQQREREREEERKFRLELAKEGQAGREELLKLREELRGSSKGTRSGGGGGGDGTDDETAALYQIMQRTGASMPEARNMLEATRQGQNPYKVKGADGQETGDADVDRYRALNRMVADALMQGPSNFKAKPDERARARQTDTETDAALAYGRGDAAGGRTALALKGSGEFDAGGSSKLTGKAAAGSLDAAKIATEIAQAQKARAEAGNVGKRDDKDKPTDPRKYAEKLVADAVNDGTLKPEEAPAKIEEVMREFSRLTQEGKVAAAIREARAKNDMPTLVKELRARGFSDEQMAKAGVTKAEMGGDKPAKKEPEGGGMLSSLLDKAKGAAAGTRAEGEQYQRIYKRWREAGSGGAPLTAEEKALARQFGLAVKG